MNPFLLYMIKSAVYLAGFYLVYYLFLSWDTNYSRNRFFLLASVLLSLIIPFISINTGGSSAITYIGKTLSEIIVRPEGTGTVPGKITADPVMTLLFRIYIAGVIFFGLKLLTDLVRLAILASGKKRKEGKLVKITGLNTSGYSAFGHIFLNESLSDKESREIYNHEMNHLGFRHFYDILFIEIITIFQWFNPVIHLANRSLRSVHEYQADKKCLDSGISVSGYQNLLLGQVLKSRTFLASNTFSNPSLLKKRMIMMTKKPSHRLAYLKLFLVVPVIALLLAVVSACGASKRISYSVVDTNVSPAPNEIFVVVEEMPQYPGGEKALLDTVYANIQYPKEAKDKNIQGRIILRFAIMWDGSVNNVSVIKGVDPLLDAEAIRVVKQVKGWKPGKQGGKPVNVWYSMPIVFQLK